MADTIRLGIPKPDPEADVDDEFYRLGEAWDIVDEIIWNIQIALGQKADLDHNQAISTITGLAEALAAKMNADQVFSLDDLSDVEGAAGAALNYILVKNSSGQWVPSSAIAALGVHEHTMAQVAGLQTALEGLSTAIVDANAEIGNRVPKASAGLLSGFRNKIINGDFDVWQRGAAQTSNGYGSDDRWINAHVGSGKTHSRQSFAVGQTDVPRGPEYYSRTVVTSVAGASNYVCKYQRVEGVRALAGKRATLTFWARADAPKNIAVELNQRFGTGGSPSADVAGIGSQLVPLTTQWQKKSIVVDIPPISGSAIGTNRDDYLGVFLWFEAGSSLSTRTAGLIQQSGTFDIAHLSLVEGDATAEDDPFSPRHIADEVNLCLRYTMVLGGEENFEFMAVGHCLSSTQAQVFIPTQVRLRSVPALSYTGNFRIQSGGSSVTVTSMTLSEPTSKGTGIGASVASGLSAGNGAILNAQNDFNARLILDAEL